MFDFSDFIAHLALLHIPRHVVEAQGREATLPSHASGASSAASRRAVSPYIFVPQDWQNNRSVCVQTCLRRVFTEENRPVSRGRRVVRLLKQVSLRHEARGRI